MIKLLENELYQELELFDDDRKIGEAEVDIKNRMLSRLCIYEPYQNIGYGKEVVKQLTEKYNLIDLWVEATNERAIHVYESQGYKIDKPTMYRMVRE